MKLELTNRNVWKIVGAGILISGLVSVAASYYSVESYACNTLLIDIKGDLLTSYAVSGFSNAESGASYVTYSDAVAALINSAEESNSIKAILLDIDSYGGLPVAGEEIANAVKGSSKSTAAIVRSAGLSAAYWAATGADHIVASPNSDVGSIGVSLQLQNFVEKNKKEGIRVTSITSGQFKGIGDPNRDLTSEERALLQKDVDSIHKNFVDAVSANRNLPRDEVEKYATGASILGQDALAPKLIDQLGSVGEAKKYLEEKMGQEVRICQPPAPSYDE